ncbi:MAG TPA: hypothetical protein VF150_03620 [Thermoanaerobaculia bacterium]
MVLRPAEPADLPGLAELLRGRFGHPLTPEEWEWKYRRLPGEGRSWVAVDGAGRVLAHAGALRLPARLGPGGGPAGEAGADPGIWQLTDWAGSGEGAGLRPPLVALGRRLLADLPGPGDAPWIFGFPSERHLRLGERVFGYRRLPAIMPRAGELPAGEGGAATAGAPVETSDHCGDWGEAAWAACGVPSVRRSAAFLNWRYHARPGRYYRFYRLRPAGGAPTEGLAVFAFVGRLARGAELWLPPAPGVSAAPAELWEPALRAVARDLAAAGLERWELWPPPAGSGLEPLLAGLGLRSAGEPVPMGCRGRGGETSGPSPADPRFHYSMGDFDLV